MGFEAASASLRGADFSIRRSNFEALSHENTGKKVHCLDAARFVLSQVENPTERILALLLNSSSQVQFRAARLHPTAHRLDFSTIPKRPDRAPIDLTAELTETLAAREKPVVYVSGLRDHPPYHGEVSPTTNSEGGITLLFPLDEPELLIADAKNAVSARSSFAFRSRTKDELLDFAYNLASNPAPGVSINTLKR